MAAQFTFPNPPAARVGGGQTRNIRKAAFGSDPFDEYDWANADYDKSIQSEKKPAADVYAQLALHPEFVTIDQEKRERLMKTQEGKELQKKINETDRQIRTLRDKRREYEARIKSVQKSLTEPERGIGPGSGKWGILFVFYAVSNICFSAGILVELIKVSNQDSVSTSKSYIIGLLSMSIIQFCVALAFLFYRQSKSRTKLMMILFAIGGMVLNSMMFTGDIRNASNTNALLLTALQLTTHSILVLLIIVFKIFFR